MEKGRGIKRFGIFLMIMSVIANPLVIEFFFSPDRKLDFVWKYFVLQFLSFLLFLSGLLLTAFPGLAINIVKLFPSPLKKHYKELLLMLATILIFLLVVEGFLRIVEPDGSYCLSFDKEVGWDAALNCNGTQRTVEGDSVIKTNSQRMRESEDFEINSSKYRIAFVGDSFVWGWTVNENERFTEILQEKLGENYEVMNFGVGGYGTDQYLWKIERDVLKFKPDMIILFPYYNDLFDISHSQLIMGRKPRYILENESLILVDYPVIQRTAVLKKKILLIKRYNNLMDNIFNREQNMAYEEAYNQNITIYLTMVLNDTYKKDRGEYAREVAGIDMRIYSQIKNISEKNNVSLLLVAFPPKEYYLPEEILVKRYNLTRDDFDFDFHGRHMQNVSEELEIPLINLYPDFNQNGNLSNFFMIDLHFNSKGHRLVADSLYREFISRNLLN